MLPLTPLGTGLITITYIIILCTRYLHKFIICSDTRVKRVYLVEDYEPHSED